MSDEPRCPQCGNAMRPNPGRILAVELLFWVALALLFAFLWSSGESRELYAFLAAGAFGAWWVLRARRRSHFCEQCQR